MADGTVALQPELDSEHTKKELHLIMGVYKNTFHTAFSSFYVTISQLITNKKIMISCRPWWFNQLLEVQLSALWPNEQQSDRDTALHFIPFLTPLWRATHTYPHMPFSTSIHLSLSDSRKTSKTRTGVSVEAGALGLSLKHTRFKGTRSQHVS